MRVGFFGGSFDPPHLGHLAVARAAAEAFSLERVLFVPAARQPLKSGGAVAPYSDRLAMVSLLCRIQPADHQRADPSFEASTLDEPRSDDAPNYTVETLARLRDEIGPTGSIFAIVGVDAFLGLPRWRAPDTLLHLAEWIVVSRPGVSIPKLDAEGFSLDQRRRIHLLEGVQEAASATDIRTLLATGSDCPGLLPSSILQYIRDRRLYDT